ncbi:hypothetical protein SLM93_000828 [Campylobacter upsaliensis]|nr:hypothetical protein [Campylobacter upsaliensis]
MKALQNLSEEDTKKRYIEPALSKVGWDFESIKMEYGVKPKTISLARAKLTSKQAKEIKAL